MNSLIDFGVEELSDRRFADRRLGVGWAFIHDFDLLLALQQILVRQHAELMTYPIRVGERHEIPLVGHVKLIGEAVDVLGGKGAEASAALLGELP